jgi:hypothetical protein
MGEQGGILGTISKYMSYSSYSGLTFDEVISGNLIKTWGKINEEGELETKTEVDLLSDKLSELRK